MQENEAVTIPYEQRMDDVFQNVDLSGISSHHLLDRAYQLIDASLYDGTLNANNFIDYDQWCRAYGTLFTASWQSQHRLPPPAQGYKPLMSGITETMPVPILLLHQNYHRIKANAQSANLLYAQNNMMYDVAGAASPFEQLSFFGAAPYIKKFHTGSLQFIVRSNLYYSNTGKTISNIQIDFNNGNGFVNAAMNNVINVSYTASGDYTLVTKITYTDGTMVQSHSTITVEIPNQQFSILPNEVFHVQATKSYNGQTGGAMVSIYYACGNTALTKPLIIVEGFDPDQVDYADQTNARDIYLYLNKQVFSPNGYINVLNEFDNGGVDLVIIDFDNGGDYIQRNAYVVEEVINQINQRKHANNSNEGNIIIGLSMGGLVARYALRDMEVNNPPNLQHECRKYISFDAPHNGANIPLGLQNLIAHLGNASIFGQSISSFSNDIERSIAILDNPAAQQMLVYHWRFLTAPAIRASFMADYDNMGWPVNCQNLAISNGSELGIAEKQPFNAGAMIFDVEWNGNSFEILAAVFNSGSVNTGLGAFGALAATILLQPFAEIEIEVHALPNTSSSWFTIYEGKFKSSIFFGLITVDLSERKVEVKNHLPYDNAPGGFAPIDDYYSGNISGFPGTLNLHISQFCFIPTVSSLALASPTNQSVYYDVHSNPSVVNKYADYTAPGIFAVNTSNEEHISLTYNNVLFLKDNIIDMVSQNLGSTSVIIGQAYNFGANATQRTDSRITNDITIGSGGKICVNCDIPLGFTGSGLNNPTPSSTFDTRTAGAACFGNIEIIIENGGILECGNANPDNTGNLIIKAGATLRIKSGGKIIIHDNSKIIVEHGADFIYEHDAIIELRGENSLLDIQDDWTEWDIYANEKMIVTNGSTSAKGGTLNLKAGNLDIYGNGTLENTICTINLLEGTYFYFHDDGHIELDYADACLSFGGHLTLLDNSDFTFTHPNSGIGDMLGLIQGG